MSGSDALRRPGAPSLAWAPRSCNSADASPDSRGWRKDKHRRLTEEEPEDGEEKVRKPQKMQNPLKPPEAEVEEHNLIYLPDRCWCRHCVRRREMHHRELEDEACMPACRRSTRTCRSRERDDIGGGGSLEVHELAHLQEDRGHNLCGQEVGMDGQKECTTGVSKNHAKNCTCEHDVRRIAKNQQHCLDHLHRSKHNNGRVRTLAKELYQELPLNHDEDDDDLGNERQSLVQRHRSLHTTGASATNPKNAPEGGLRSLSLPPLLPLPLHSREERGDVCVEAVQRLSELVHPGVLLV